MAVHLFQDKPEQWWSPVGLPLATTWLFLFQHYLCYRHCLVRGALGRAAVSSLLRYCTMDRNLIVRFLWPVPAREFISLQRCGYCRKDSTNTPVSGEWVLISVAPRAATSTVCNNIFVSASCVLRRCVTSLYVASHSVPQATARRFPLISAWWSAFLARYSVGLSWAPLGEIANLRGLKHDLNLS